MLVISLEDLPKFLLLENGKLLSKEDGSWVFSVMSNDAALRVAGASPYQNYGPVHWFHWISSGLYNTSEIDTEVVDADIASANGIDPSRMIMNIEEFELLPLTQSMGTVTYDHTGNVNGERTLTSTAHWPAMSPRGHATINEVDYEIDTKVYLPSSDELQDHIVTLASDDNPGEDITDPTACSIDIDDRAYAVAQLNIAINKWGATARRFGMYGIIPHCEYYWSAANYAHGDPTAEEIAAWETWKAMTNANVVDLAYAEIHALFPSLYAFYRQGSSNYSPYYSWEDYANGVIDECYRVAAGRPIYPFIWPMYHPSVDPSGSRIVPLDDWTRMVDLVTDNEKANGFVVWSEESGSFVEGWRNPVIAAMNRR